MNVDDYERLLPEITQENRPFWDGLRESELRLQCCDACSKYRFPDSELCPHCLSGTFGWRPASGNGRLWSWIIMHQRYYAAFQSQIPYLVAYVKLEEGPAMISTLVGPTDGLAPDMPVKAVFEPGPGDRTILTFAVGRTQP